MQGHLVDPIPMWGAFSILRSQLRSYGQSILALFEELNAGQGGNGARIILDQEMTGFRTQSDTMKNELATTIEGVWSELFQRLSVPPPSTVSGPVPQNGIQHMEPNPNSMPVIPYPDINAGESEYISTPQSMYSSPPAMGPPPNPSTNPGINGFAVQGVAAHPQTPSLTPGAPGVGEYLSEWSVTLEWPTGRTRVRVVEETSEVLVSTWPAPLSLQAVECNMDMWKFQDWMRRVKRRTDNISEPSAVRFRPAFEEDQGSFDRLIEWLRHRGDKCYAVASWEIEGKGHPTRNLILRPCMDGRFQGLFGAAFPVSGIPAALPGGAGSN